MVAIHQRNDVKDTSYKVAFKRKGHRTFSIHFDDWEAAWKWAEDNEHKYYLNPNEYHVWRADLYLFMRKKKLMTYNHIRRPKIKSM